MYFNCDKKAEIYPRLKKSRPMLVQKMSSSSRMKNTYVLKDKTAFRRIKNQKRPLSCWKLPFPPLETFQKKELEFVYCISGFSSEQTVQWSISMAWMKDQVPICSRDAYESQRPGKDESEGEITMYERA